jgi:hypothetical protein
MDSAATQAATGYYFTDTFSLGTDLWNVIAERHKTLTVRIGAVGNR